MTGEELHKQAESAREQGNFVEALKLTDEATVAYQKERNVKKLAEVQASRAITLRHLFGQTGDKNYLILAKYAAKAGVKIIENSGADTGKTIPLYVLGEIYEHLGKFEKAAETINEAIDSEDSSVSKTKISEMKVRLDGINYRLGEPEALGSFESNVKDLESGEFEDDYVKNVWISGAYMHMAESMIDKGEAEKAKPLLSKAEEIISSDPRLKLRAEQLGKIKAKIS